MSYISASAFARMTLGTDHYLDATALQNLQDRYSGSKTKPSSSARRQKQQAAKRIHGSKDMAVDGEQPAVERRRSYDNVEKVGGAAGFTRKGGKKTYHMLRDRFVQECHDKMSDFEIKLVEEFYKSMAQTVQRNLTRKAFVTMSRPFLKFRGGTEVQGKNPLIDRVFALLDIHGHNVSVGYTDFVNMLSVFLRGGLEAQRFCTFHALRLSSSTTDDQVDVITREDLFRHVKLGTAEHRYFGTDVKLLFQLFEEKIDDAQDEDREPDAITFEQFRDAGACSAFKTLFVTMLHEVTGQSVSRNSEDDEHDALWVIQSRVF